MSHVAVMSTDNAGLVRCRILPSERFDGDKQPNVGFASAVAPVMYDLAVETPVGQVYVSTETKRHQINAWMTDTAASFGDIQLPNGDRWERCSRTFLRRQIESLAATHSIEPTVGFELEFQLLRDDGVDLTPVDSTLYGETRGFHPSPGSSTWDVLREVVRALKTDLEIPVLQYHAESASGQFEISIGPFNVESAPANPAAAAQRVVEAVDNLVLTRQCIYGIASLHGYRATFIPKLRPMEGGNASHFHLGLRLAGSDTNVFEADVARSQQFTAGIIAELPSIIVLLASSINSYERLQPHSWAGAFQCHGYENREAPVRGIAGSRAKEATGETDHLEIKTVDATANPYLALGALVAAGALGIERKSPLPPPVQGDPALLPSDQQPARLPGSLRAAIDALKASADVWEPILSPSYFSVLIKLREAELEHYEKLDHDDLLKALVQRF